MPSLWHQSRDHMQRWMAYGGGERADCGAHVWLRIDTQYDHAYRAHGDTDQQSRAAAHSLYADTAFLHIHHHNDGDIVIGRYGAIEDCDHHQPDQASIQGRGKDIE